MEKKKTILIAVFVNAGLLALLFIAALTMQDETASLERNVSQKPLYTEAIDTVSFSSSPKQEEFPSLPLLQLPVAQKTEEPVIHHLPPQAMEAPPPAEKKVPTPSFAKPIAAKASAPEKGGSSPDYYVVKVGDNPWTIAMKHHIKVDELLKMNSLNEEKARKLKPGDRLRIR